MDRLNVSPRTAKIVALASGLLCLVVALWIVMPLWAQPAATSADEIFRQANQAYEQTDFAKAAELYQQLVDANVHHAGVFYNLGNAWFKQGNIARAILNYERALLISPRDRDVRQNLELARSMIVDRIDKSDDSILTSAIETVHGYFSFNEWAVLLSVVFQLICLLVLFRMINRHALLRELALYLIVAIVIVGLVVGSFFTVKWNDYRSPSEAIVMKADVTVHSGPDSSYTVLLKIHRGLKVSIIESRQDDWCQIQLANGYQGWIQRNVLELI